MFKIRTLALGTRRFSSIYSQRGKNPNLNQKYLDQRGEQPIPLSAEELRSEEVKEIELPQATTDEKIMIKNAMKRRSLRMTFLQLFLITILSSSTLNVMRQKNELEELEENFQRELTWLKSTIELVESNQISWEEIQPQLTAWNARFEALGLPKIELSPSSMETSINKETLKKVFQKQTISSPPVKLEEEKGEKLDRFL